MNREAVPTLGARTKAVLNEAGTHYILNGTKQWITNAGWADFFVVFAKVDGTHFTVPGRPGYTGLYHGS